MTERVGIQYDIQGADRGAAEIARLKDLVGQLDQELQRSTPIVSGWEEAAHEAGSGAAAAAQGMDDMGSRARNVASHVQGLAGQVGALAGRLGSPGLAEGAHLVGALAGVTSQSLALTAALGPAAGVASAVIGLMPVLIDLVGANEQVAQATDTMTSAQRNFALSAGDSLEAIDQLIRAQRQLASDASRRDRIGQGLGTVDEQFAAAELAGRRVGTLAVELQHAREIEASERAQFSLLEGEQERHARIEAATARRVDLEHQVAAAREESHHLGELATQVQEEERQIATEILEIDQEDAAARAQQAHHGRAAADARRQEADAARQQRDLENLALHGSGDSARGVRDLAASITDAADARDAADRSQVIQIQEVTQQRRQRQIEEAVERQQRAREAATRRQQQMDEQHHRERMQRENEYANALDSTGQKIGSVFTQAFNKAISGQEDFGQALAEGAKQQLLQTGEQMVIEGAGALLTAAGLAFLNPPAAGGKAVEGAGKIALGVGLGAAGVAIPAAPSGGGGKAPEPPASSRAGGSGDRVPAPIVINLNAPSVIGGTQAQWGRDAARSIREAQQRFGRIGA